MASNSRARLRSWWIGAIVLLALLGAAPASAQPAEPGAGPWSLTSHARLRLVSATEGVPASASALRLGLEFRLDPGWKIYWRNPGAGGLPPELDWTGSTNLADATLGWPAPHRFSTFGLESFGYSGSVVLPVEARLDRPGEPLALLAQVGFLICSDICVPEQAALRLALPVGEGNGQNHAIEAARGRIPRPFGTAGVTLLAESSADRLTLSARSPIPLRNPDMAFEPDPLWPELAELPAPAVSLTEGGRLVTFTYALPGLPAALPERLGVTLWDDTLAVEGDARLVPVSAAGATATGSPRTVATGASGGLAAALLAGLLGGLILNLMPCVLPVLAMKLAPLLGVSGTNATRRRQGLLASAAGIVSSMLLLGFVLALVKQAGGLVGWGVQFQEPWFVALMAGLTFLFALNLWELLPIGTPRLASRAAELAPRRGLSGDFATGFLATALATPCSAPFVGTAAGFALARGTPEILAVFASLGLGLAAPWLLVAARPRLVASLPRPGAWMGTLRIVLGLLMLGTTGWLLSVLLGVGGTSATLAVALALASMVPLLLLLRRARIGRLGPALVAATGLVAAVLLPGLLTPPVAARPSTVAAGAAQAKGAWRPFEPGLAERLAASGETVLVDITAAWCVTCQVNKALVIDRDPVASLLSSGQVVALRGDWTRPDPAISAFLAQHGRYGIPFNVVYGPGAPQGLRLPELLTEGAVLRAIETATRSSPAAAGG